MPTAVSPNHIKHMSEFHRPLALRLSPPWERDGICAQITIDAEVGLAMAHAHMSCLWKARPINRSRSSWTSKLQGGYSAVSLSRLDQALDLADLSENNTSSPQDTIDLHGLYVKEALERTELAIQQAQSAGQSELRIIVGKGIHSQGHVAKIKPAVEEMMQK